MRKNVGIWGTCLLVAAVATSPSAHAVKLAVVERTDADAGLLAAGESWAARHDATLGTRQDVQPDTAVAPASHEQPAPDSHVREIATLLFAGAAAMVFVAQRRRPAF